MNTHQLFRNFGRYNRWYNEQLYAACADVPDAVRKEDRGAFFKSIHRTLNHLLLADRVWMGRFTGVPFTEARSLDQELYSDFNQLCRERAKTDEEIESWVASLTGEQIAGDLHYVSLVNPEPRVMPLAHCILHFFNHQTHHRGQITVMLTQAGYDYPVPDMLWMVMGQ